MKIDIKEANSTYDLPPEISLFFAEIMANHISNIKDKPDYLQRFNMNISMDLSRCRIETLHSTFNLEKPYWEQLDLGETKV